MSRCVRTTGLPSLVLFLSMSGPALAQSRPPADSLPSADWIGALLQTRGFVEDVSRPVLDEIARTLRTSATRPSEAPAGQAAVRRLLDLLGKHPKLVTIAVKGPRAAVTPAGLYTLVTDTGALLLRIQAGEGETHFSLVKYDLAATRDPIPFDILPGTTWGLVDLQNAPGGLSTLTVQLSREGQKPVRAMVSIEAPMPGRLKITVNAVDTGKPAPSMICLTCEADGRDRRPSNAIDLAVQFEGLGRAVSQRHATLPGRLGGHLWWCVPGPFDMPVPPGQWQIIIRRGLEHAAVFDTFTTASGKLLEKTYTPRRWTDMPKLGWYSADDHVHARLTSDEDAARLMTWTQAEDVHVANILHMGDIYRTWFQQRGFGPSARVQDGNYLLSIGQEDPRTHSNGFGHTITLNARRSVRDAERYWLYRLTAERANEAGGVFGFAHVLINHISYHRGLSLTVPGNKVNFAEILQVARMGTDLYYAFLNLGFKLSATAGSDVPYQGTIGEVRVYAGLGERAFSPDAWFEAFARGRTFVTNGPMLTLTVDDAQPGDQLDVSEPRKLKVRARAWGDPEVMVPRKLQIIRHGDVLREIESTDPSRSELSLEMDVDSGNGFWIAARAEGSDGSFAHTTPVYVVQPGLRFWNFDAAAKLLDERLANLAEIDRMIADAHEQASKDPGPDPLAIQELDRQSKPLREEVAVARRAFQELKGTLEAEKALRSGRP